jgi:putative NIF3 family GTP cyclohydrolase 1 type 2
MGSLGQPLALAALARVVKECLNATAVQFVGVAEKPVQRVAIVCGAGGEMLKDALAARVDVFLTGEMRFHDYLSAQARELALVLPGHYATERCGVEELAENLQRAFADTEVWASRRERDPVTPL